MPGSAFDMMGYCDPMWVSDYAFNAIFNEIKTVNGAEIIYPPACRAASSSGPRARRRRQA
jgi:hypothetical protein